jgi:hypothetical protein
VFAVIFSTSSFLSFGAVIYEFILFAATPRSDVKFRCAVQSSALCDGVYRLHESSTGTVVVHFFIGLTEHRHGNPARSGRFAISAAAGSVWPAPSASGMF